jgi:hypothetical protein
MAKFSKRRYPIGLPLILDIRLSLFSKALGRTRTTLSEEFLTERLTEGCKWREIKRLLRHEAEIRGVPLDEVIREALEDDGFTEQFDLENLDLEFLLEDDTEDSEESLGE